MFKENNAVPNVKINVKFETMGDEITLTCNDAFDAIDKLRQIYKEHNAPFKEAEIFTFIIRIYCQNFRQTTVNFVIK